MRRSLMVAAVLAAAALSAPSVANACSRDDSVFYETFIDTTCLQLPLTSTTLDALGGLRLTTNGVPVGTIWDTDAQLDNGITHEGVPYPPVGVRTLVRNGTGAAAALGLPTTLLPLTFDPASPVLGPPPSAALDSDNVDDPALAKVGSTYVMWYSGTAENGGAPAIFMATSGDGLTWTRGNGGAPVLEGTPLAFDESGVFGPDVVYDPADPVTPYRMWYSGRAGVFGAIGYATSVDGVAWVKSPSFAGLPVPVLTHGQAGSADSFGAADPTVLRDGSTWKMWYTGDDSNKKRVAYATSVDGITWTKGGKVIAPEDPGVSANIEFGAFAPTVWKSGTQYRMLLTGRKLVGQGVYQTKIMDTSSPDGVTWTGPSPALNPSGSNQNFDYSNLNSPELLQDPSTPAPYKLLYSGNTIDANGNFHTRIGLATSANGTSFSKFNGSQTGGAVFDIGTLGTAFDAREASGLTVAAPAGATPSFVGFYSGTRGSDFKPRLGEATSSDGTAWTKVPVSSANGGALFALGNPASFDNGGQLEPGIVHDGGTFHLFFTGLSSGGTRSIGYASSPEDATTKQPTNAWSSRSQLLAGDGSGFDSSAVGHPSVVKDGATYVMFYTGLDAGGSAKIGRATASSPTGPWTRGAAAVLSVGTATEFDGTGVKDPVVVRVGAGDYRMLYTGVETLEGRTIERLGYATSTDGSTWTKRGVVAGPSATAYAYDEVGVQPSGALVDGSTLHVWTTGADRTGRRSGGHASTPYPTPATPQPGIPSGSSTYQLGGPGTTNRDFRQIARTSSGSGVSLWVSFLQPYSSQGSEFWSDFFPVTVTGSAEALNFLLNVRGVRWQARLSDPAGAPALDKVELTHAPVSFSATGSAASTGIGPSPGRAVTTWRSFEATMSVFSPSGGGSASATARLVDAGSGEQLATTPLSAGTTTLDLTGISAPAHQALRVHLDLRSADGLATPRIGSFKVVYDSAVPVPGPPPAPPVLTLLVAPRTIVFGRTVTLSGNVTRSGAPLPGQTVALGAQPIGTATFAPLPSATTDAAGTYRAVVRPMKRTTYKAGFAGITPEPTVVVSVKHSITLRAVRRSGKLYLRGTVGPRHVRRLVIIQKRRGTRWVTVARVRTTRRSTFQLVRTAARTRSPWRARIAADREHLANFSRVARG